MNIKSLFLSLAIIAFSLNLAQADNEPKKKESAKPVTYLSYAGKVIDKENGEALAGVRIALEGTSESTYTDFDGNFVFENIQPGNYKITAELVSYKKKTLKEIKLDESNNKKLHIKLQQQD